METKFVKGEPILAKVCGSPSLVLFVSEEEGFVTYEYYSFNSRGVNKKEDCKPLLTEGLLNKIIEARPTKSILKIDVAIADIINWVNQLGTTDEGQTAFETCQNLAGEFPIGKLIKAVQSLRPLGIQKDTFGITIEVPLSFEPGGKVE